MIKENRVLTIVYVLTSTALSLLAAVPFAQNINRPLTLKNAVSSALLQNKNITIAGLDEKIAMGNYKQTNTFFLPKADVSYSALTTNNPLNAFGFKLQQQGATQQDFAPAILNHPGAVPDFAAQVGIQQPLLNLDMLFMRKSVLKLTELQHYKTLRTQDYITWQVKQAYLQLGLAYDILQVLQSELATAKETYRFINDRYQQGLLQKYDLLNAGVQVSMIETNIAEANSNIKNASDALSLLMGTPQGIVYLIEPAGEDIPLATTDTLPAARADFKAMQTAVQSYDLMIKGTQMQYLPRVNAFANYQWHNKSLLGFGGGGYIAGVQLSWNIFSGFQTKNKIITQLTERDKISTQLAQQKDENLVEVNKTKRALQDAQYKITRQQKAVEESTEALRVLQNRYSQELTNTTDILAAQTQVAQQKLGLAQVLFARSSAVIYLQFLTTVNQ